MAKKSTNGKAPKSAFADEAKITVLAKTNPKRPKTKEHKRFSLYKNGMSIARAKELGMDNLNFSRDVMLGYIKIG